jgi:cytidyltransferase-like protein
MTKITTLNGAVRFSKHTKCNKTVGLVVGSFDILHLGHINLFRFAKRHADILIVGLDNDETIKLVKGKNRPINNFKRRSELLSDLKTVDKIFEIKTISHHDSEEALESYRKIVLAISPTYIFTHKICDNHWREKVKIAKEMNITFLLEKSKKITNSGTIIKMLSSEM